MMQILLDKIGIINLMYEKLEEKHEFNIFSLLRSKGDEVNVHSNFIHELLNPQGSHKRGTEFLKKFLEVVGIKEFEVEEVQVYKEQGKIDLLIHNRTQAIIIENKIWAEDQDRQLERYYRKTSNRGFAQIWLVYLTLQGTFPSDVSIGDLEKEIVDELLLFSYAAHISEWIESCIAITSRQPILRETLIQYKHLIEDLTGKSMNEDKKKDVLELLSKNDNIIKAHTIAENWVHVRWHTEWDFWADLEEMIKAEKKYTILPYQKFSSDNLTRTIHFSRNKNPWYGLMIELFEKGEDTFCLFIERGLEDVYYGITIVQNGQRTEEKHREYDDFASKINEFSKWGKNGPWLGGNWLEPKINFETFSEEPTLRLINKEYRQEYLAKNWLAIKEFISAVKTLEVQSDDEQESA